ncbi:helix-turn-helix domain-containing protein [Larkinella soli]|uniref:helix-turn-helix domain-containing protein n=1 Tax=Larkinella soli TaxID=1770527 RepID=UPI000FFC51CE|nr:helix-turn-helix domain-containing protein [Larkinella soli]
MSLHHFDIVSSNQFVARFMGNAGEPFVYTQQLIQIYPLSFAPAYIKAPTTLFRAQYNFFLLFRAGGGEQQVDNDQFELQANDILFIREGHLNAIKSIHPATDGYFIYIDSVLLAQLFGKPLLNRFTFNPKHSVSAQDMGWLCQCCELIIRQNRLADAGQLNVLLLKAVILKLAETWPLALFKPGRSAEITMLFKELLYDHFMRTREVKFYADALSVSENYINRCVNQITNKPPKQHINEMVIYHSKVLLQDFSRDIAQVAFELNFSDPSYFGRLFRQLTALTPSEYRNRLRQDLSE